MRYTDAQYAQALYETAIKNGVTEGLLRNFLGLLEKNRARNRLSRIMRIFEKVFYERQKIKPVRVTAARELPNSVLKFPKDTEVKTMIDAGLLGGLKIRVGDYEIDNSVKGSLEAIKRVLL